METLDVTVSPQLDGVNFAFDPLVLKQMRLAFPNAKPIRKIFIVFNTRESKINIEPLFDTLKKYILPAMVGAENAEELKKIKKIHFWDPSSRVPEATINFN